MIAPTAPQHWTKLDTLSEYLAGQTVTPKHKSNYMLTNIRMWDSINKYFQWVWCQDILTDNACGNYWWWGGGGEWEWK